ncbi:hypothetical protein OAT68_01405 [Flavobacteriaceae bacterium]|nr:hypothetical protein [Flavobacteriaceae bacterium]
MEKFDFEYDKEKFSSSIRYRLECKWKHWALKTSNFIFLIIILFGGSGMFFFLNNKNVLIANIFAIPFVFGLFCFRAKYWLNPKTSMERLKESLADASEGMKNPRNYAIVVGRCPSCNKKLPKPQGLKCPFCTADF